MGTVGKQIVGDRVDEIIDRLNQGIAAEINDAYRYLALSKIAAGIHSEPAAAFFASTSQDEWGHVALLMDRVVELGGRPLAAPAEAGERSYAKYLPPPREDTDVKAMLTDSLEGEREAIRYYRDLFEFTREVDPVTAEIARSALRDEISDEDEIERMLAGWPER